MDWVEIFAISCSAISSLLSLSVIATVVFFPIMLKKLFMRIIVMISLCDLIGSVFYTLGFPKSYNILCPVQGAISLFFYRASFFWTTLLTFQLYSLVTKQNLGMSEFRMHLLSWLSCIALELIPLHNAEYGQDDIGSGVAWCSIANLRSGNIVISSAIWISVTFIVPLILCMTLMIIFYILIKMHYRYSAETINAKEKSVVEAMFMYPLGMFVAWSPNVITSIFFNFESIRSMLENESYNLIHIVGITNALGSLYGAFLAIIFFANSREARQRWRLLFSNRNTHLIVRGDDLHITDQSSNMYFPDVSEGEGNSEYNGEHDPYLGLLDSISQQSSPAVSMDGEGRQYGHI